MHIDPDNYDLREATCKWFVDNFEEMEKLIPEGYPRTLETDKSATAKPIYYAALFFAAFSLFLVVAASAVTFIQRKRRVMRLAQVEFLALLLLGLMMVAIGSLLVAVPPTTHICTAAMWMVNIGYTLELVPLVVRMAAIFKLMRAAAHMQHASFTRTSLFTAVAAPTVFIAIFLIIWNCLDPPHPEYEYRFTYEKNQDGESIVAYQPYCATEWDYWYWLAVGWHFLLLLTATVQAFQARTVMRKFADESQTLAIMIYSHFVFVWFRLVTYLLHDSFNNSDLALARSLVFSLDTIFTIFIYFVPKFLASDEEKQAQNGNDQQSETPSEKEFRELARLNQGDNRAPSSIMDAAAVVYSGSLDGPQESAQRRPSDGEEHPGY